LIPKEPDKGIGSEDHECISHLFGCDAVGFELSDG
jgi:hypothetical protein